MCTQCTDIALVVYTHIIYTQHTDSVLYSYHTHNLVTVYTSCVQTADPWGGLKFQALWH